VVAFGSIFLEIVFGTLRVLPGPGEEIFTDHFAFSCGGRLSRSRPRRVAWAPGPGWRRCSVATSERASHKRTVTG
jgi:hypothetical protein